MDGTGATAGATTGTKVGVGIGAGDEGKNENEYGAGPRLVSTALMRFRECFAGECYLAS